jgi:hypothetical protein
MCTGAGCAPEQEILKYVTSKKLSFYLKSLRPMVDNTDFNNPVKWSHNTDYLYAQTGMTKYVQFGLQENFIQTDAGYLQENLREERIRELKVTIQDSLDIDQSKTLFWFEINANNKYTGFYRSYIKIPEIIASVGGLVKSLTVVFAIINAPFAKINRNLIMINELVNIKDFDEMPNKPNKSDVSKLNISNFADNTGVKLQGIEINNFTGNSSSPSMLSRLAMKKKLNLSRCEVMKVILYMCFKSKTTDKKMSLFNKSIGSVNRYFDFIDVIKTLEEFNLLKRVVFDNEQYSLFEVLKKTRTNETVDAADISEVATYMESLKCKVVKDTADMNLLKLAE